MELLIKKEQDKGMLGGIKFVLHAKVKLSPEEEALIKKYKAYKEVLYESEKRLYTISDLIAGEKQKCKDVSILLNNEKVYINVCEHLKILLDTMKSFGGVSKYEFKDDGIYLDGENIH